MFRILKSYNTNISHQFFDYTIQKMICTKKPGLNVRFKDFWYVYKNKSDSDVVTKKNNKQ